MFRRRAIRDAFAALDAARSRAEWQAAADALDGLLGLDEWRRDDQAAEYDARAVQGVIDAIERHMARREPRLLVDLLHTALHRHLPDVSDPGLYDTAFGGTKHLVGRFYDAVVASLDWLCDTPFPGVTDDDKLAEFTRQQHTFGRSALMLSGGATLGFFHLGVVKALFEAGLLPRVLSGASMGAMIAAGIATRTDEELHRMFADLSELDRQGLALGGVRQLARRRAVLDPDRLLKTITHNVGEYTFEEAHRRTGRTVNISVSPTRRRQKPRVLCHLTSPDVLLPSAALASSSVPGLFPPTKLQRRSRRGKVVPYLPDERWIDGSMRSDLPMVRVSRLHNVNHFIVSQANPHVVPFVSGRQQKGLRAYGRWLAAAAIHRQGVQLVSLARDVGGRTAVGPALDVAHALWAQAYSGDIDIVPPVPLKAYLRVVSNPTEAELADYVLGGERGTWPELARVRDSTRISRTLSACRRRLERRIEGGRATTVMAERR
jgi:NTE family protein